MNQANTPNNSNQAVIQGGKKQNFTFFPLLILSMCSYSATPTNKMVAFLLFLIWITTYIECLEVSNGQAVSESHSIGYCFKQLISEMILWRIPVFLR
jgi:hypothetical protein